MKKFERSRFVFALALAATIVCLPVKKAIAGDSVGIPNFNEIYATGPALGGQWPTKFVVSKEPQLDVYPSYVQAAGLMLVKTTNQPAYEWFTRTGYEVNGKGGAKPDMSISKMQIESDLPDAKYFGIFQSVDGHPFSIVKDMDTGQYWLHGDVDDKYKAAICSFYDNITGLVSGCNAAQPRIDRSAVERAVSIADMLGKKVVSLAEKMDGFNPPGPQKPDETAAYIERQRQNVGQLKK